MNLETGAKEAFERLCRAYGFKSRLQLAKYLDLSNGTLGNRISRDNYPADLILRCALETGAPLRWLALGEGEFQPGQSGGVSAQIADAGEADIATTNGPDFVTLEAYNLNSGDLRRASPLLFDRTLLDSESDQLIAVLDGGVTYVVDKSLTAAADGKWLIMWSGKQQIRDLILFPGDKIKLEGGKYPIDCDLSDVVVLGKIIGTWFRNE